MDAPAASAENHLISTNRRSGNYHATVWGEHFLACANSNISKENLPKEAQEHERLKEEVRKMLIDQETSDKFQPKLDLIDSIQRLGVAYHFETEIEALVPSMLEQFHQDDDGDDLYVVSLRFRLLRQLGHYVSCDVFNKFKDPEGNFMESLVGNVPSLLSFYEAANFRVHDEDILEEALTLTTSKLKSKLPNLNKFLAPRIREAIEMPIQKTMPRLGARRYISIYDQEEDSSHNIDAVLLSFAKLDFNILQREHKKELSSIIKWWNGLDCPNKLPFARDRVVDCFFWILENERGEVAKAVECYMKQYGTSKEEAIAKFQKQITNAWTDTNKECLLQSISSVPTLIFERILNLSRMMYVLYKDGSGYTNSSTKTKDFIIVLVDTVPI